jgi:hypothetical protein
VQHIICSGGNHIVQNSRCADCNLVEKTGGQINWGTISPPPGGGGVEC